MENLQYLLIELLESNFGVPADSVGPDTTFDDVDVDSLIIVELALILRKRLGIELEDWELKSHFTIAEAAQLLATKGVTV